MKPGDFFTLSALEALAPEWGWTCTGRGMMPRHGARGQGTFTGVVGDFEVRIVRNLEHKDPGCTRRVTLTRISTQATLASGVVAHVDEIAAVLERGLNRD